MTCETGVLMRVGPVVSLFVLVGLAGCDKPDVEKPTLPITGYKYSYDATQTIGSMSPFTSTQTYTFILRDDKIDATLTTDKSDFIVKQTLSQSDPVFSILRSEFEINDPKGSGKKKILLEADVHSDNAFPMSEKTQFSIKFKQTTTGRVDSDGPVSTELEKDCSVGQKQKLHVPAGTYDVLPVVCKLIGSKDSDVTTTYNYAPEVGLSVHTEINTIYHNAAKSPDQTIVTTLRSMS